jgi:hypothetical protein
MILVKWLALLDNTRLEYVGVNLAEQIVMQFKQKIHPIRLDLPGRKTNENTFYTFIGKDAVDALVEYFEKERGWPRPGEPVWLSDEKKTVTRAAFKQTWMRLLRRIGLISKKRGNIGSRYGYNPHEMRDLAKSFLHTHAKKDGFDMDCAEFWLGHVVDPLGYDKFHLDQEYVRKQYLIAEKYLNIISTPPGAMSEKEQEKLLGLINEMEQLKRDLLQIREAQLKEERQHALNAMTVKEKAARQPS